MNFYFWNETLHVSDSSSVHHQEFSTVHTAMVYVIQVCIQLASRIKMELSSIRMEFLCSSHSLLAEALGFLFLVTLQLIR
jgi:hypothetical protein